MGTRKTLSPTNCARILQNPRRPVSTSRLLLCSVLIIASGSASLELARSEPAAQLQRAQPQVVPQQSAFELAGLQDSSNRYASNGGGGGGAASAEGAGLGEGLTAFANSYKRGPFANTKRARKMSAFMPMRGRKDGRDLVGPDSIREARSSQRHQIASPTERLLGGSVQVLNGGGGGSFDQWSPSQYSALYNSNTYQQTQVAPLRESEPGDMNLVRLFGGRATLPRQFFNQVQARALTSQGYVQSVVPEQQVVDVELGLMTSGGGDGGGDGDAGGSHPDAAQVGGRMMLAKPRRAFHPMRGKRSSSAQDAPESPQPFDDLLAGLDQLISVDEL